MKITLFACRTDEILGFGPCRFGQDEQALVLEMSHTKIGDLLEPVISIDVDIPARLCPDSTPPPELTAAVSKLAKAVAEQLWVDESNVTVVRGRLLKRLLLAAENLDDAVLEGAIKQLEVID